MNVTLSAKIKDRVEKLLREKPHLRDCDEALMANIWYHEATSRDINTMYGFLDAYSKGLLTNGESVRRIRQKLQEVHPELRGDKYNLRHDHEVTIKKELKQDHFKA
jgi:hypothetical protein